MKRNLFLAGAFAVLCVAVAFAGDDQQPWKTKDYQQWDANDVRTIWFNSPWAQTVAVDATMWKKMETGGGRTVNLSRGSVDEANGTIATTASTGVGAAGSGGGPEGMGQADQANTANPNTAIFTVRWASSEVERQASVRNATLNGRAIPSEQVTKYLSEEPAEYQLIVLGSDMTQFVNTNEKTLKEKAFLQPTQFMEKIPPSSVQIRRDSATQKVAAVVFTFPKKLPNGEPIVGSHEKFINFNCSVGPLTIATSFELEKMVGKKGPDL